MDYRNDMRRDPFARGAQDGRFSPAFAPAKEGSPQQNVQGASCPKRSGGVVSAAVQKAINTLPLAMVYAPEQKFEGIKDLNCALEAGTIFDALDLPFTGCRRKGGRR